MKKSKTLSLVAFLLATAIVSRANGGKLEPLLQGYVTDAATKKPVPGVTVSAVNVKGAASSVEVTTDAEGFFHFSQLPSQQINLQFEKKGYQVYKRSGVLVTDKSPLRINVEFSRTERDEVPADDEYLILHILQVN